MSAAAPRSTVPLQPFSNVQYLHSHCEVSTDGWTPLSALSAAAAVADSADSTMSVNSFFDVFVNFTALADTTGLPNAQTVNTATVAGAIPDLDGPNNPRPPETVAGRRTGEMTRSFAPANLGANLGGTF